MLIIKKIIKISFLILILRFLFEKQIRKCKNNIPVPNIINFFINKITYWTTKPLNIFFKKLNKKKKELNNIIIAFFLINLFVIYFYGENIKYNIFNIIIISTTYLFLYFLKTVIFTMILEIIINFLRPFSNLNYFINLINFNILKNILTFKITINNLSLNINLIIYIILFKIIIHFLKIFIKIYIENI